MITLKEIIKNEDFKNLDKTIQANLLILLDKINQVRKLYNKPMIVTSGLRSMSSHLKIYKDKGITDPTKIPMKSHHLYGRAIDISDPKGELKKWILANPEVFEALDLYMEDFKYTPTWVHIQIVPFGSYKTGGTRFFRP